MSKSTNHPIFNDWKPDLTDLTKEEISKVEKIKEFIKNFLTRVDSQNKCYVYLENSISFDYKTGEFNTSVTFEEFMKYMKGIYSNKDRFLSRWVNGVKADYFTFLRYFGFDFMDKLVERMLGAWDSTTPFTYAEAFQIKDSGFKALVFGTISITEMIKELDGKKLKSATADTIQNNYAANGDFIDTTTLKNKYETYECDGEKLGVTGKLYAVKCTCTTTGNTHYLWLPDGTHKNDPLAAIASTFWFYTDLIQFITGITRQGDTWYPEYESTPESEAIIAKLTPESPKRSLTKEEYFDYVVAQS